ncbi:MAG: 1-(5-phosphoribosyl)-5-[(5-phosphoribosylamino)methylideneamino]imidazole-4-carboxamide isomerase [bacterium]
MAVVMPAVDIRGGRCVRLFQGRLDEETVYFDRPADAARRWAALGAEMIHVVDLDGAFQGEPVNLEAVADLVAAVDVPIDLGGGIRTDETVARYLDLGVQRVALGTQALRDPEWLAALCERFAGHIVADIGARDGRVAVEGWAETSAVDAVELAGRLDGIGLRAIVFTDAATDGAMRGPNLAAIERMVAAVGTPVVASGGIATLEDVRAVAALGVEALIIGKALFDGAIELPAAMAAARQD